MGTLFVEHFDSHAEGLGDHEDVAEDYGCVEEAGVALDGLEGDCGGEFGVATDGEEVIGAFGFVVLWGGVSRGRGGRGGTDLGGSGQLWDCGGFVSLDWYEERWTVI